MKTIAMFLLLKAIEIGGVFIVYWGFCHLGTWWLSPLEFPDFWVNGILPICLFTGGAAIIIVIAHFAMTFVSKCILIPSLICPANGIPC